MCYSRCVSELWKWTQTQRSSRFSRMNVVRPVTIRGRAVDVRGGRVPRREDAEAVLVAVDAGVLLAIAEVADARPNLAPLLALDVVEPHLGRIDLRTV